MQFLLIHGGTFDDRCWDRMRPHLTLPAVAVVQPGRGDNRPDEIRTVGLPDYRATVADTVARTPGELILVAHSLAGLSVTAGILAAPERVRHVVLLSCAVPPQGGTVLGTTGRPEVVGGDAGEPVVQTPELVAHMAGEMTAEQLEHAIALSVPEPGRILRTPATLEGWEVDVPKTWVRLARDTVFPPDLQTEMAARAGVDEIVDLDAGHLAMFSRPEELAGICNEMAAKYV
ncbi:alpha/beta fold hydrolase [Pseudonocardia ailaonensis]|uniref:Alpha/beta fold hydrolase n=1 Tax=Pseudonocardia ailaonensis TaxID=367279 RepID=A0ABN2NHL8_9PSEU